ncbi:hypothetical protein [Flavobacterium suzhouense]|uniref:Uncharacterized protein n=1 Tax=Flavobacterium suzhouense TaxID=1529638 RepID=A0ABW5NRV0_9FLAO
MTELADRVFRIWVCTISHHILILRSPMKFPDQDDFDENHTCNIDIEFDSVTYLDIPWTMSNIEIRQLIEAIPEKFAHYKGYEKVFEFKCNEGIYYIVANSYKIGTNTWINENRVFNMRLEYDSIIKTSDH